MHAFGERCRDRRLVCTTVSKSRLLVTGGRAEVFAFTTCSRFPSAPGALRYGSPLPVLRRCDVTCLGSAEERCCKQFGRYRRRRAAELAGRRRGLNAVLIGSNSRACGISKEMKPAVGAVSHRFYMRALNIAYASCRRVRLPQGGAGDC